MNITSIVKITGLNFPAESLAVSNQNKHWVSAFSSNRRKKKNCNRPNRHQIESETGKLGNSNCNWSFFLTKKAESQAVFKVTKAHLK